MPISRNDILNITKSKVILVDIPNLGEIRLREMTGVDRDSYFAEMAAAAKLSVDGKGLKDSNITPNLAGIRERLLAKLIVDIEGNPMFTAEELCSFKAEFIDDICVKVFETNKIARMKNG